MKGQPLGDCYGINGRNVRIYISHWSWPEPWKGGHLQLVGHQNDCLPPERLLNALLKDVLPHMAIHSGQGVVQEIDLTVRVDSTGQADPLLLSPRQIEAPLPNLQTDSQSHCV